MDLVDKIDKFAKKKGWSRSEVLRRIDLSPAAASDWRKGKASPEKHIARLASLLDVSESYLRGEVDDPFPETGGELQMSDIKWALMKEADQMDDETMDEVLRIARLLNKKRTGK